MIYRKTPSDEATAGSTGDDSGFKVEGVHKLCEVPCEIVRAIALRGATRIAMPPLGQGEGVNGFRQARQHSFEGAPRVSNGMQKYDRNTR